MSRSWRTGLFLDPTMGLEGVAGFISFGMVALALKVCSQKYEDVVTNLLFHSFAALPLYQVHSIPYSNSRSSRRPRSRLTSPTQGTSV